MNAWRARVGVLALWAAALFGLWQFVGQRRVERGDDAIMRLRAFPFGAGRHTRLEAGLKHLSAMRGEARFEATAPPWVLGPVEVMLVFAGRPAGPLPEICTFEVDGEDAGPVDAPARALADWLAARPPPEGVGLPK